MKAMNIKTIRIPPTKLNCIAADNKINDSPKYIGFLEYLKTPETTNEDAFSGCSGLTVVFCFLKDKNATIKVIIPSDKNNALIIPIEV
jgi:hypothetical protein